MGLRLVVYTQIKLEKANRKQRIFARKKNGKNKKKRLVTCTCFFAFFDLIQSIETKEPTASILGTHCLITSRTFASLESNEMDLILGCFHVFL